MSVDVESELLDDLMLVRAKIEALRAVCALYRGAIDVLVERNAECLVSPEWRTEHCGEYTELNCHECVRHWALAQATRQGGGDEQI
jgi:hypothetical protein